MCVSFFFFCKPLSWPFAALQQLVLLVLFPQAAPSSPVFQGKGAVGLVQPWYTRGCFPAVLPGKGDGFLLCHVAWGVVVGGQAAGAGLSQELLALVQGPRVLWCFEQKLCQSLAFRVSPPLAKASARVSFDWDMECTAPRGARHGGSWVAELATGSILGSVLGHRMEAVRCPTAWGPVSGLMPCQHSPWLGPSPHSTCSPWVLGNRAAALGHSWSQPLHFKPSQEMVATAEPWAGATSLLVVGCGTPAFVGQSGAEIITPGAFLLCRFVLQ